MGQAQDKARPLGQIAAAGWAKSQEGVAAAQAADQVLGISGLAKPERRRLSLEVGMRRGPPHVRWHAKLKWDKLRARTAAYCHDRHPPAPPFAGRCCCRHVGDAALPSRRHRRAAAMPSRRRLPVSQLLVLCTPLPARIPFCCLVFTVAQQPRCSADPSAPRASHRNMSAGRAHCPDVHLSLSARADRQLRHRAQRHLRTGPA